MNTKSRQRYEEHKEEEKEKRKQRYENNKEATLNKTRDGEMNTRKNKKNTSKTIVRKTKKKIKARAGEVIECECGFTYTKQHKSRHFQNSTPSSII